MRPERGRPWPGLGGCQDARSTPRLHHSRTLRTCSPLPAPLDGSPKSAPRQTPAASPPAAEWRPGGEARKQGRQETRKICKRGSRGRQHNLVECQRACRQLLLVACQAAGRDQRVLLAAPHLQRVSVEAFRHHVTPHTLLHPSSLVLQRHHLRRGTDGGRYQSHEATAAGAQARTRSAVRRSEAACKSPACKRAWSSHLWQHGLRRAGLLRRRRCCCRIRRHRRRFRRRVSILPVLLPAWPQRHVAP